MALLGCLNEDGQIFLDLLLTDIFSKAFRSQRDITPLRPLQFPWGISTGFSFWEILTVSVFFIVKVPSFRLCDPHPVNASQPAGSLSTRFRSSSREGASGASRMIRSTTSLTGGALYSQD